MLLTEAKTVTASNEKQGLWCCLLQTFVTGASQMLPFVIRGGIMIAPAFLIDGALVSHKIVFSNLGSYHEPASMFMKIGGAALV